MQPETARVVTRSLLLAAAPVGLAGFLLARQVIASVFAPAAPAPAPLPTDGALDALTLSAPSAPAPTAAPIAAPAALSATDGPVDLSLRLDRGAVAQGGDGLVYVEVKLTGDKLEGATRKPTDLVVVLDRSGSMSGEKFADAKRATNALMDQLMPEDRFALVAFDSSPSVEIGLTSLLAADSRAVPPRYRINTLELGGGTNISGGMELGLAQLKDAAPGRSRRVVLISDGQPTDGDTSDGGLMARARGASSVDATMTAVGVGMDFNEDLMRGIADAGTGNYYFLESGANMARVLGNELLTAAATVASAVEVHVDPGAGVSLVGASGYAIEHSSSDAFFRVGTLYGGQERSVWLTLRVDPSKTGTVDLGEVSVRYQSDDGLHAQGIDHDLAVAVVADPQQALASIDREAWEQRVVTDEYQLTQLAVASAVKAGDKASADRAIADYRSRNSATNAWVGSEKVEQQLQELQRAQAQVDDSFSGEGQAQKQNVYSKRASKQAVDQLRSLGYVN